MFDAAAAWTTMMIGSSILLSIVGVFLCAWLGYVLTRRNEVGSMFFLGVGIVLVVSLWTGILGSLP